LQPLRSSAWTKAASFTPGRLRPLDTGTEPQEPFIARLERVTMLKFYLLRFYGTEKNEVFEWLCAQLQ
jgi:hypothetical protein